MLGSNYLMADESTIRVLDQDKKEPPTWAITGPTGTRWRAAYCLCMKKDAQGSTCAII
ncbi:MAG: hypothetical protein IPK21_22990 [Haliscomenobacter sp.]|nr:hypothetical protein [Haliscomenobacter sp.]